MCEQILPTSTIRNIWRTVRRTCMLIVGIKGLSLLSYSVREHHDNIPKINYQTFFFFGCNLGVCFMINSQCTVTLLYNKNTHFYLFACTLLQNTCSLFKCYYRFSKQSHQKIKETVLYQTINHKEQWTNAFQVD